MLKPNKVTAEKVTTAIQNSYPQMLKLYAEANLAAVKFSKDIRSVIGPQRSLSTFKIAIDRFQRDIKKLSQFKDNLISYHHPDNVKKDTLVTPPQSATVKKV